MVSLDRLVCAFAIEDPSRYILTEQYFEKLYMYFVAKEEPIDVFNYSELCKCCDCGKNRTYTIFEKFNQYPLYCFKDIR